MTDLPLPPPLDEATIATGMALAAHMARFDHSAAWALAPDPLAHATALALLAGIQGVLAAHGVVLDLDRVADVLATTGMRAAPDDGPGR